MAPPCRLSLCSLAPRLSREEKARWLRREGCGSSLLLILRRLLPINPLLRLLLLLAALSLLPPAFFHFRLRRFHRMRERRCGWVTSPPMVCAHGGDSTNAFPNSMDAFRLALDARVDCVEVDVSRSSDGVLFVLHDRDLQRMSGNSTAKVGFWSSDEIKALSTRFQLSKSVQNQEVPKAQDVLALVSQSVRQVILDVKVGPPSFEKDLAEDVLSIIDKTQWSKVAGVYHRLIHKKLMKVMHSNGKKVYAWTVDDADSMKRMLYEHVDAIVTSNPALLQQLMQEIRTECMEDGFALP
uniref:glycerophosphodiester phosphodiesterase n=1 Tax=Leersia perrieri TaxID=77586 RepID=A0A0D9XQL8_9ORYZ